MTKQLVRFVPKALFLIGWVIFNSNQAHAGVITRPGILEVTEGIIVSFTEVIKTATGFVELTSPTGQITRKEMPVGGGKIRLDSGPTIPEDAIAASFVDLDKQKMSSASISNSNSGWTAKAKADIHKTIKVVTSLTTVTRFIPFIEFFIDPNQTHDGSLAPGVTDSLLSFGFQLDYKDASHASPQSLLNSTTTINHTSPDTVSDDTGLLTWKRAPGLSDGINGDFGSIPNYPTNNRWVMDNFSLKYTLPEVTVNPGESYLFDVDAATTTSTYATGATQPSVSGSSILDVPGPLPILGAAAAFGWSRKLRKRLKSSKPEVISTTAF